MAGKTDPDMRGPGGCSLEGAAAVAFILRAGNHYEAIDAPRSADASELRRQYLRASVLVHPDKNPHPDATQAFQRVAASWTVLSDPERRRQYDDELRCGRDQDEDEVRISPEDAFAAFSFAAAATMAGGGGAGDVADTLFWAQQLGQFSQFQRMAAQRASQQQGGGSGLGGLSGLSGAFANPAGGEAATSAAVASTASGLALSAGLWGAGALATMAGLPRIGSTARRIALIQGLSNVALASQIPEVRTAAVSSAKKAATKAQRMADRATTCLGLQGVGDRLRQSGETVLSNVSGVWNGESCLPQARKRLGWGDHTEMVPREPWEDSDSSDSDESQDEDSEDDAAPKTSRQRRKPREDSFRIRKGTWVSLTDLQKARHLEGRLGEIVGFDISSQRFQVQLIPPTSAAASSSSSSRNKPTLEDGAPKLVRRQNLKPAFQRSLEAPSTPAAFI